MFSRRVSLAWKCLLFVLLVAVARGDEERFELAVDENVIDFEACRVYADGKASPVRTPKMLQAMGIEKVDRDTEGWWRRWSAGRVSYTESQKGITHVFRYRIAFKEPVKIGSILSRNDEIQILKSDAPYPGAPARAGHWRTVSVPEKQGRIKIAPLPTETTTRAVLLTDYVRRGRSSALPIRLYKKRLFNIASQATVRANREYHVPRSDRIYRASNLAEGRGTWRNTGKNDDGRVIGPIVSENQPAWYVLAWDKPREIAGIFTRDNFSRLTLERFQADASVSPLIGIDREWRAIKPTHLAGHYLYASSDYGRWVNFSPALTTRGLRFLITGTWKKEDHQRKESQVAWMDSLLVLTDLGDEPVPDASGDGPPPAPLAIDHKAHTDGTVTMVIDDEDGRRVRNLVTRAPRSKGKHTEHWDLKDEDGKLVVPGTYRWKAINGPELKLEYEMTTYPNVTVHHPDQTAWLNGRSGPGGWLADHAPPFGGDAGGGRVIFTCPVPEAGVGFAVCDLSGKKLWGIHGFAAWSGGRRLVTTGEKTFVEQFRGGRDRIWRVNHEDQSVTTVLDLPHSESRRRGISGIAYRDGKVYAAVDARARWISNATGAETVEILKCLPRYKEKREPRKKYEVVPDKRNDFLRLLRLKGTPPGYGPDHGLTWLESTSGPGPEQYIMVAFEKPVNIGSCVYPVPQDKEYRVRLNVLKEDAPYPPNPAKRDHWKPFKTHGDLPWDVAQAPPQTRTRALLIRFVKGEADDITRALQDDDGDGGFLPTADTAGSFEPGDGAGEEAPGLGGGKAWRARLEGLQILRRRFKNLFGSCKVRVSSGRVEESGKWVARRDKPLTETRPAIYLMEWGSPVELRGLAIKEIDAKETKIDVWTGPETGEIPLRGGKHWETLDTYVPRRRMEHVGFDGHNANALYMNGRVDFGRTVRTRAVRLRAVSQWTSETRAGSCAKGRLQLDPTRCRVFGVAPVQYVGGEVPVDPRVAERIEIIDSSVESPENAILRDISISHPGDMEFSRQGRLFALSGSNVVQVDLSGEGKHRQLITDLKRPTSLTVDAEETIYVFDTHPDRKMIRVYSAEGKFLRSIGKPGGYRPGPWDPMRFNNLSSISVDREGKLWVVDSGYWPKRVGCFTSEGEHLRDYLGPTQYGGGGVLDPYDKSRMVYGPLEFEIDWETGKSRLKNLLYTGGGWPRGEIHIKYEGHDYFTSQPAGARGSMPVGMVYLYEEDHFRPVAAMGMADDFAPLEKPAIVEKTGERVLTKLEFTWTDHNGNGEVDPPEVEFRPRDMSKMTRFNRDMGVQAGSWRFVVDKVLENGAPVYKKVKTPVKVGAPVYRLRDGSYYHMGDGDPDRGFRADGSLDWSYKNEGAGVGPNRTCGPYWSGQVVCQFGLAGHAEAAAGDLGEFFVMRANRGSWYLWTSDGLLASRIFKSPFQHESTLWAMPENDRNMDLTNVSLKQEAFRGWFCRTQEDDRYFAVAGKPHASVVEVKGIDDFRRSSGTFEVTPEDIADAIDWQKKAAREKAEDRNLRYYHSHRVGGHIAVDGKLDDWKEQPRARISDRISFAMAHDDENLYVAYEVRQLTDLVNQGNQWRRLFKSGACVDLMLSTNREAPADRARAAAGDMRILFSRYRGRTVAVLYRPVVPGATGEHEWTVESPVNRAEFDVVRRLREARVAYRRYNKRKSTQLSHFVLEAAIPLEAIDLEIRPDLRVKMDWGYLRSNREGTDVLQRMYWSNQAASTLADTPTEAMLSPGMWGYVQFHDQAWGMDTGLNPRALIEEKKEEEPDLEDFGL